MPKAAVANLPDELNEPANNVKSGEEASFAWSSDNDVAPPTPTAIPLIGSGMISSDSESSFVVKDKTTVPQGPLITALRKSIYLRPSESAVIDKGNAVSIVQALKILTFDTQALTEDKTGGGCNVRSRTLIPGNTPIAIVGSPLSLTSSASELVVGSNTITPEAKLALPPSSRILTFGTRVSRPTVQRMVVF